MCTCTWCECGSQEIKICHCKCTCVSMVEGCCNPETEGVAEENGLEEDSEQEKTDVKENNDRLIIGLIFVQSN